MMLLLSSLLSLFLQPAHAQMSGLTGSQAVVCYGPNHEIQSAELFDLYEARQLYRRQMTAWPANTDFLKIAKEIALNLDRASLGLVTLQEIDSKQAVVRELIVPVAKLQVESWERKAPILEWVAKGTGLKKTNDAPSVLSPSCKVKQLSTNVDSTDKTYVSTDIWEKLDPISQAAFIFREPLYRRTRIAGAKNSEHARRTLGLAFSGYRFQSVLAGVPETFHYCASGLEDRPRYQMVAYEDPYGKTVMQFITFDGEKLFSKATITVDRQAGPLADPKQFLSGFSGLRFDQPADLDAVTSFKARLNRKKKVEFSMARRIVGQKIDSDYTKLSCVPARLYSDEKGR